MNLLGPEVHLWEDYLPWGFALAIVLSLVDYYKDGFAGVSIVVLFFLVTDIRENLRILLRFVRAHKLFVCGVLCSTVHFLIYHPVNQTFRLPLTVFFIVFAGYRVAVDESVSTERSIKKMGIITVSTIVLGLFWYLKERNDVVPYFPFANTYYWSDPTRLGSVYVHPLVAACIIMACTILLLGALEKPGHRIALFVLAAAAILFTKTRMAILVFSVCMLIYAITFRPFREIGAGTRRMSRKAMALWGLGILMIAAVILIWKRETIAGQFSSLIERFKMINTGGNVYRWDAWAQIMKNFFARPAGQVLGGSGLNAGYNFLDTNAWMIAKHGDWSGPVDNMYVSAAYDLGIPGIVSLVYMSFSAVWTYIRGKDRLPRLAALALIAVFLQSLTADFQYWPNISFVMYVLCGIHLGLRDAHREQKV